QRGSRFQRELKQTEPSMTKMIRFLRRKHAFFVMAVFNQPLSYLAPARCLHSSRTHHAFPECPLVSSCWETTSTTRLHYEKPSTRQARAIERQSRKQRGFPDLELPENEHPALPCRTATPGSIWVYDQR